jgi:hypothetical protein
VADSVVGSGSVCETLPGWPVVAVSLPAAVVAVVVPALLEGSLAVSSLFAAVQAARARRRRRDGE